MSIPEGFEEVLPEGFEEVEAPKKKEKGFKDYAKDTGRSIHMASEQAANAIDTFFTMQAGSLSRPFSEEFSDKLFKMMEQRKHKRIKNANPDNLPETLTDKVIGAGLTLPVQIPAMLASPAETGQTMIEQGESLPRSMAGAGVDTVGNMVGAVLPGGVGKSLLGKVGSGFGINAAQDVATRKAIESIAEKQSTKDILGPSVDSAVVSGIVGGGLGGLTHKGNKSVKPKSKPIDLDKLGFEEVVADTPLQGTTWMEKQMGLGEQMDAREQKFADQNNIQGELDLRAADGMLDENGMPVDMARSLDAQDAGRGQVDLFNEDARANVEMQRARDLERTQAQELSLKERLDNEFAPVNKEADVERAYEERQQQMFDAEEQVKTLEQETGLVELEQKLREGAYKRPDAFDVRQGRGRVPKSQRGAVDIRELSDGFEALLNGKRVGYLKDNLQRGQAEQIGENANIGIVKVDSDVKGTGVGSALYKAFNEKHGGRVAPSGKTTADAWKVWKRNYPEKVDEFVAQEAARLKDGADPRIVIGNITDPAIAQRVLSEASSFKIPKSQRGAIDLGTPEPKDDRIAKLSKDSPEVVAAQEQLRADAKRTAMANILNNPMLDAYTAKIDTPEKVVALAPTAKDITPVQEKKARTISPGMNAVAISSNNPLLRYTRDSISKIVRQADQLTREYVTGPDGFGSKLKKLSQEEKNQVVATLQHLDRKQLNASREQLKQTGLNDKQVDLIEHIQMMDAKKLEIWNDVRMDVGLEPVKNRAGHFAGNFSGDYRTLVYDWKRDENGKVVLDKAGNRQLVPAGFVGTATKLGNELIKKQVKKQFPDATFADTKRVKLGGSGAKAAMFEGMQDILSVLAKNDPRFADIKAVVDAAMKDRGDSLYGAALHEKDKKGIWGNDGNKFWEDQNTNTNEALKSFVDYWEGGIASHLNLPVEVQLKGLMDNPALDHMPRAKRYVNEYINNFTGRNLGTVGDAINTIIDTPSRLIGVGPSVTRGAVTQFNKRASQFTMGFLNPLFLATQYLQVPQTGMPELIKLQSSLGLGGLKAQTSLNKAVSDGMKLAVEEFTGKESSVDRVTRDAYQYAKDNGLLAFSEYANARDIFQNKYSKGFDTVADFAREKAEQSTRPLVFFAAVNLLRESGMSPKEIFDTAYNVTQHSMVNYHASEKPLMYSKLGVLGNAAGSLQTFKHAFLGQLGTFIKDAAAGNPAGLATAALAIFAFSGLKGVPFYQEADELFKAITDKFYKDRKSIAEAVLPSLPEWAKSGVLSTETGVNMQSRLSSADVLPNSAIEAVSPFSSWAGRIGTAAGEVVSYNDPMSWKSLGIAAAPSGTIKGAMEAGLKMNNQGQSLDRMGRVDYQRTQRDTDIKKYLGGTSLDESLAKEKIYNNLTNSQNRKAGQEAITKTAQRLLAQNQLDQATMQTLIEKYKKEKGDPQQLVNALVEFAKTRNMTSKQRLEGMPSDSLSSIYRYQNYND